MSIELSQFQNFCLQQFIGKRALTETGLARQAKCEKAVAKFAIKQLLSAGFLKHLGTYEFAVTSDGELYLKRQSTPMKDGETKTVKPKPEAKSVLKPVDLDSLEVLDLPASSDDAIEQLEAITGDEPAPDFYSAMAASMGMATEGVDTPEPKAALTLAGIVDDLATELAEQAAVSVQDGDVIIDTGKMSDATFDKFQAWANTAKVKTEPVEEPAIELPAMGNLQIEKATIAKLPAPDQAEFHTLVRQGLARLNSQLGVKLVTIEHAELKVEALTNLSASLKDFDLALSVLLADVARDIQRVDNRLS